MRQLLIVRKIREIIGILICTLVTDSLVSSLICKVLVLIFILELLSLQQFNNHEKIRKGSSSKSSNLKYYRKTKNFQLRQQGEQVSKKRN